MSAAHSIPARLARWLLAFLVRHWPEETRSWGMALAAEIDETTSTLDALRWSWGGIMLFARSVITSTWKWLKLPAGASLHGTTSPSETPALSRRSRLLTACLLIAGIVLLSLPLSRQAMNTVRDSWRGFGPSASERKELDKLAVRAEKENDAATLAFVALRVEDPAHAEKLMERAVSLNPDFAWVYAARSWPQGMPVEHKRLARLHAFDSDNAVPILLAADAVAQQLENKQRPQTYEDQVTLLASDAEWMRLMQQAFTSLRYDSYLQRHTSLTASTWSREPHLSPAVVLEGLFAQAIPNLLNMRTFSKIQIREAEKAASAGDWNKADGMLTEVDSFSERIAAANSTGIEKLIGRALAKDANQERIKLDSASGRDADAQKAHLRLQQIAEALAVPQPDHGPGNYGGEQAFWRWGILLHVSGALAGVAGCAGLVAILLLEILPAQFGSRGTLWWRSLYWLADYAPAVFLIATAVFLVSFLPYVHAISESFSWTNGLWNESLLTDALSGLVAVPHFFQPILIWSSVTAVLAAAAIFITGNSIYRSSKTQTKQV